MGIAKRDAQGRTVDARKTPGHRTARLLLKHPFPLDPGLPVKILDQFRRQSVLGIGLSLVRPLQHLQLLGRVQDDAQLVGQGGEVAYRDDEILSRRQSSGNLP